jgi:hypothetical protein
MYTDSRFFFLVGPCGLLVAFSACSSSTTATNPEAANVDPAVDAPNYVVANDAETDAGRDASTSDGDAGTSASDGGACSVERQCTNPSTPAVPPEISGTLPDTCAPIVGEATDLQSRCTIFCRQANPGFSSQTTCFVESSTTFGCRCVNP